MSRRSPIGVGDDGFVGGPAHLGAGPVSLESTEVGVLRWNQTEEGTLSQTGEGTFEAGQYDAAQLGGLFSESDPGF